MTLVSRVAAVVNEALDGVHEGSPVLRPLVLAQKYGGLRVNLVEGFVGELRGP